MNAAEALIAIRAFLDLYDQGQLGLAATLDSIALITEATA